MSKHDYDSEENKLWDMNIIEGNRVSIVEGKLKHVYTVLEDARGRNFERQRQAIENLCIYLSEHVNNGNLDEK